MEAGIERQRTSPATGQPLRLLLIEDSEDDALLILRELRRGGYAPVWQRVEREGELQAALKEGWDLITSDYYMPFLKAEEALQAVQSFGAEAPFILISGRIGEETAVEALKAGAHDYVMKDNLTRLCPAVERALREFAERRVRREAERRLAESEERFKLAVAGADDGIWDWDIKTGNTYFSPRWKAMLGYEDHELPGRFEEWRDRIHPQDRDWVLQRLEDYLYGRVAEYEFEHRVRHRDGSYRWIRVRGILARDENGEPARMAGAHWDVTERMKSREELVRRGKILEAVSFAAEVFLQGERPWAQSIDEVLGRLGRAAGAGRAYIFENFSAEDGELWASRRGVWSAEGENSEVSPVVRRPYAHRGWSRWAGALGGGKLLHGRSRDFPAEERAGLLAEGVQSVVLVPIFVEEQWWGYIGFDEMEQEREWSEPEVEALRSAASILGAAVKRQEMEEQYRGIFESTGDGLVINALDGTVVEVNPAFCHMHGYSREELVGSDPRDWISPKYHHVLAEFVTTVREGGEYRAQAVDLRRDGTELPVEVTGTPFIYRGRPHILGVVRDVTERVQAYRLLEQRVSERTRELAALLEISSNVASTLDLEPLLGLILDQLKTVVDYSSASILMVEGEELVTLENRGPAPRSRIVGSRFMRQRGALIWEGSEEPEPMIIEDIWADEPRARAYRETVGEERLREEYPDARSWMGVPITFKGEMIGLMVLLHDSAGYFSGSSAGLARSVASQAAIAIENARLYRQAGELAALEERQRLARELHDSVSQALYGIALGASTARTLFDRDPQKAVEPLDYVLSLAEAALSEMRALIFELRPESLEREGIVAALQKQAEALRVRHHLSVSIEVGCEESEIPAAFKQDLYGIAREAVHNAVKHARGGRVWITLECVRGALELRIADDGAGFDPSGEFSGHLGLKSMRERALKLGGELDLRSGPGEGTSVVVRVPL